MRPWVYLAGPINGCTDDESVNWRETAKTRLGVDVDCLDPMRRDYRGIEGDFFTELVETDKNDISSSSYVIANCWKPSFGTAMEILYAHSFSKPVVVVVPSLTHVSPWLSYHATVVDSLDAAIATVQTWISAG